MTMVQTQPVRKSPPLKIMGLLHARWANQVLNSAIELGIFSVCQGGMTSDQVAGKLSIDRKGARLLLDALVSMELLVRDKTTYKPTELASTYLVEGSPLYLGSYILDKGELDQSWGQLTNVVRTGKPHKRVNDPQAGQKFFVELVKMIYPLNYTTAQLLADHLDVQSWTGKVKVLDLAAGSGVWSLPMACANRSVEVDALDLAPIIEVTREYATRHGAESQYKYLEGRWQDIELAAGHYDIIILGHILHAEGKELSQRLLEHCARALKPGGKLVVAEFISNDEETGPVFPRLFALNMLIMTENGCVFTQTELKNMLQAAGLPKVQRLDLPYWGAESPLMIAEK